MKIEPVKYEKEVLDNGFVIYYIKRPVPDVIYMNMYYRAGSGYEKEGQRGISHFLEHLMFKGTKKFPGNYLVKLLSYHGGDSNAYTSWDSTVFYAQFPQCISEKVFEYERDRMENLTFQDFHKELNVVLDEKKLTVMDNPFGMFSERLFYTAFFLHPYRYPVIGVERDLKRLNPEDVKSFYDEYYSPNNSFLVLSGNVTPQVINNAVRIFGEVKKKGKYHRVISCDIEPEQKEERLFIMKRSNFNAVVITLLFKTVPLSHEDSVYLDVISTMLGDGRGSYLYKKLVKKKEIFSTISTEVYETQACTLHTITGTVRENISPLKALKELRKVLQKPAGLFTKEHFKRSLFNIYSDMIYSRESIRALGDSLGEFVLLSDESDFNEYPVKLFNVRFEKLEEIYEKYFDPEKSTCGVLTGND